MKSLLFALLVLHSIVVWGQYIELATCFDSSKESCEVNQDALKLIEENTSAAVTVLTVVSSNDYYAIPFLNDLILSARNQSQSQSFIDTHCDLYEEIYMKKSQPIPILEHSFFPGMKETIDMYV